MSTVKRLQFRVTIKKKIRRVQVQSNIQYGKPTAMQTLSVRQRVPSVSLVLPSPFKFMPAPLPQTHGRRSAKMQSYFSTVHCVKWRMKPFKCDASISSHHPVRTVMTNDIWRATPHTGTHTYVPPISLPKSLPFNFQRWNRMKLMDFNAWIMYCAQFPILKYLLYVWRWWGR